MTIKPRARKFRIHPDMPLDVSASEDATNADGTEDGFGPESFGTARKIQDNPADLSDAEKVAGIEKEGLTGRQLRMARRAAIKYGLDVTSDIDAVHQLRQKGIDPFKRTGFLAQDAESRSSGANLPSAFRSSRALSTEVFDEAGRADEIYRIQRDIARRRRRNLFMLFVRLSFFVFLPTFLTGFYFFKVATPLYATNSEFIIQQADGGGAGLGGLLKGTGFATSQDSITVQSYLQSRDAMMRLDADIGFKAHFSGDSVDPLIRLEPDSTNEAAYKLYKKMVKIGYDPTEGLIKMEVTAADPQLSARYSQALIGYAEQQVDNLTQRLRADQMLGARETFGDAENKMLLAQERVLELQERLGVMDPASETSVLMSQIGLFETQLQEKRLQLQQLLDNTQPNVARVDGTRGDIQRLEGLIADLRSQLTQSGGSSTSLARITGELRLAEMDLVTRQAMMQQALQQLEASRIEANRQVRYLSLGVSPVPPDEATYPRSFENTLVAFFIFSGIYLMASLTAAILREQVSA